ncbi:hypothetical protein C7399_1471 [Paraburkholderia tropica]|uniref:Uncharacterized protein n=1 Tax=Paraburkholderia tropica TaxID=92647 RepID=A0ABX5MBB2_9BURK|nr:hypothetical protein C7400_1471 [Paraburkholderia tropica]PZW69493.1 hypothetical protein C7399_1471 [Paraburkholderia tropica]
MGGATLWMQPYFQNGLSVLIVCLVTNNVVATRMPTLDCCLSN